MGLGAALGLAVSGLRATQSQMGVLSDNIANVETPGYSRKTVGLSATVSGDRGAGVRIAEIRRELDLVLQRQLRNEGSGAAYAQIRANVLDRVNQMMGTPGSATALDNVFNKFTASWQALSVSPDSYSAQRILINDGQVLAQTLNRLSQDIQSLRVDAERGIDEGVRRANEALRGLATIDEQIATGQAAPSAALLDQRDRYVSDLSEIIDIRVIESSGNRINIYTNSGVAIYTGRPGSFSFDGRTTLDANSLYSTDNAERGVGTVTFITPDGGSVDMFANGSIRSGEIAAYKELRDVTLPQIQERLDALAGGIASALSDETISGVAITNGFSLGTSWMRDGNVMTVNYTDAGGVARTLSVVRVESSAVLPLSNSYTSRADDEVLGIDFSAGMAAVAAALDARLGAGFAVTNTGSVLEIATDGSDPDAIVSQVEGRFTNSGLNNQGFGLPFFTDGASGQLFTSAFSGIPQQRGFSARIAVNADVVAAPSSLVAYEPTTLPGDGARPAELYRRLTAETQFFSPATGIGGTASPYKGSAKDFVSALIDTTSYDYESAKRVDEGQQVVVNALLERNKEVSGVSIDKELADLLVIQNAYAANARVMSTVRDMFERLMNS